MTEITSWLLVLVLGFIYFTPTIVAVDRKHNNTAPIFVINLLCGWTFFIWVFCLAWSYTDNVKKEIR